MSWVSVQGQERWGGSCGGAPGLEQPFLGSLGSVPTLLPPKNSSQLLRELAGQERKSLLGSIISMKTGRRA